MANKQTSKKDVEVAKKVVKKAMPNATQRRKIYRRSGFRKAVPYLLMFFALILAICFIMVRLAEIDDGAGVIGNAIQLFFCGLLGGAAFLLPVLFGYIGAMWCVFHIKWRPSDARQDGDNYKDYKKARRRIVMKTVFASLTVLIFSIILGVFEDPMVLDFGDLWVDAAEELRGGGIIGSTISFFMTYAFAPVISLVILFILLAIVLMLSLGLTPDYIIKKIRMRRELREEDIDFDDDYDEKRMEALRQHELERAKKRRQKQLAAARKQEIRRLAQEEAERLQPLDTSLEEEEPAPKRKPKKEKEAELVDLSVDDMISDLPSDDDVINEPEMHTIDITPSEDEKNKKVPAHTADEPVDYGGDSVLDELETIEGFESLESVKESVKATRTSPKQKTRNQPELELGEISKEDLAEDVANVVPEDKGKDDKDDAITPYVFPPIEMLAPNQNPADTEREKELRETANLLQQTLKSFRVDIEGIQYSRGPTITRYELKPAVGTRVRSIANLVDDIALSLATSGVRIEAPIPNKAAVGIEVPNRVRATVYLRDLIDNAKFVEAKSKLTSCLGMDVGGNPIYFDIAKMPHLLIAGATGMGKSVCINSVIISILYKARPEDVKLILIDPKKVEFNIYKDIPHLYAPIVSDPKKAAGALASAVAEMERRFELIEEVGVRDIGTYNAVTEKDPEKERMPHMVIIIDELADLMMTAPDDVEACICRLAQKARAAGIHIIIGTQRPSVDVITGLIKANIPSRIACTVASQVDSRTIIDIAGAEKLIGRGDMLFAPVGAAKPMRVQGAFVSEAEVEKIVSFIKANNAAARYNSEFVSSIEENAKNCGLGKKGGVSASSDSSDGGEDGGDSKFHDAVKLAIEEGKISTSLMQRRLGVGYGRAAKIIDTMEELGYVSKPDGNKPRRVLITMQEYMDRTANGSLGGEE